MSFLDEVDSIASKAYLRSLPMPIVIGIVVLVLLVLFLSLLALSNSLQSDFSIASEPSESTEEAGEEPSKQPAICVHVVGAVASPGMYELPEGSRLSAAIEAAGGFTEAADQATVNLARVLQDGEQILVRSIEGEGDANSSGSVGGSSVSSSAVSASGVVNINLASAEELQTLNGIGAATAQKIIADRDANGPFASVDDLTRVSGIGEKKLAAIRDRICV